MGAHPKQGSLAAPQDVAARLSSSSVAGDIVPEGLIKSLLFSVAGCRKPRPIGCASTPAGRTRIEDLVNVQLKPDGPQPHRRIQNDAIGWCQGTSSARGRSISQCCILVCAFDQNVVLHRRRLAKKDRMKVRA